MSLPCDDVLHLQTANLVRSFFLLAIWEALIANKKKISGNSDSGNILKVHGPCSLSITTPSYIVPVTVIGEPPSCNGMKLSEWTITKIRQGIMVFEETSAVVFEFYSTCVEGTEQLSNFYHSAEVMSIRQAVTRFW
ncbi:hypothetical protein FocTR4_00012354 [Fusarium oxysporum f. sp. cubense]|uniref:Uncharacterized protein n=1 Tax=Fusarium oxysporum f. sp. cubense TaxID=61366 RepID=A0A5C6SKB3_FUSOC|nr:hypothetical protein FocTR4_00012354 [Fusarium oxysporum f. sp. cubense]